MYNMEQKFHVTLIEDQRYEIFLLHAASFIVLIFTAILFDIQNRTKNNLLELAQSNFVKTEEIAKEMVQVAKAKDIFVSSLSHEIRNPLNCMNGSIDYLLQVVKNPSHLQILNNAKMSGEILLNLLSNVLDAAKLKAEKMELLYAEANIIDAIKKALILFCENIREKKIKTTVFIDKALPHVLWTDSSRILQIIINLISNALKFSPEGGNVELYLSWCSNDQTENNLLSKIQQPEEESILVDQSMWRDNTRNYGAMTLCTMPDAAEEFTVYNKASHLNNFRFFTEQIEYSAPLFLKDGQTEKKFIAYHINEFIRNNALQDIFSGLTSNPQTKTRQKGFLKVQVTDNGRGISQNSIPKLFEMFSQADNSTASANTGSGLGLWICKQLISKMGGKIALDSQVGRGTSFVFYVPIDNEVLSKSALSRPKRNQDIIRALVVDDYPYNRDMQKLILEKENVQVSLACDGKEAVDTFTMYEEDYFQFIMMDVNMPVMDGFTAAKKVREWEARNNRKKVDIYFVSGEYFDEEEVIRHLGRVGGKTETENIKCLKKPIDVGTIKKLVGKFQQ